MENNFIINNLLQKDESVRLELKTAAHITSIAKTITAFINTQGGDILIGVSDNKEIIGVENANRLRNRIQHQLIDSIKPNAPISSQVIRYKGKDLILISVWEGANKPYQYKGQIFTRENDRTKLSNQDILNELISERKAADFHWERRAVLGATLEDLDKQEIDKTIDYYQNYKADKTFEDEEDFLIQTGLMQNGHYTNACIVLFAKSPTRFIPQSKIRITVYPSDTTGDRFLNDRIFDGNVFSNISGVLSFLDVTFGKSIIVDGVERKEKLNYPLLALREGLLNAMVHRDYNSVNGFLQISIFSDRTEIANYGGLPDGITLSDLRKEHNSILRNPDIAKICFIRKYIEMLGSGTLRMINDCKKNKFKTPSWKQKNNITTVVFPELKATLKNSEGVNEGVNEGVKNKLKAVFIDESEGVKNELISIYEIIETTPNLKTKDIATIIDKGLSTTERYLKKLKDEGFIEFVGSSKTGGYDIKKN
ncbi:RNA-binding domain-containing protein [Arenibacter sp. S6351L]|uniref:RNA-binding domain-containing protein n=1 Tax=Arenibacter sp. S6351L TaxID=2926407 RepID=UPI001FF6E230|nr:RNA-binding domain-containing protein [Arenibacter sp. S6351L]MCK0137302.1 putative DNA binding domain-containing protein [Arenibacter sp. S6351L]